MKKFLLSLLVFTFFFFCERTFASEMPREYFEFSKTAVEKYYKNRDMNEDNDLSKYFSNDMLRLLNMKIDLTRFQNEKLNRGYSYYNLDVVFVDEVHPKFKNGKYSFELQIVRKMQYSYVDDLITTISSTMEIEIGKDLNGNLKIYESFEPLSQFELPEIDSFYREEMKKRSNLDLWAENFVNEVKEDALKNLKEIKLEDNREVKVKIEPRSAYLNRQSIVDWARNNYYKSNPKGGSSQVSYYDFSNINGNYDCTNFVSHSLLAGGCGMVDKGRNGIVGTDQWYFRNISNRSSSWSGVNEFYRFITSNKNYNGPIATEKILNYSNAYLGDIVQGGNSSGWHHTTVVTGFKNNSVVLVTGRTSPRQNNNNQDAKTIYSKQRLLHLEPK